MKKNVAISIIFVLSFIGCGYKPSSVYTTPILGKKIATNVNIDVKNPTDSVFLKDALNEAVLSIFNAKHTNTKDADSSITLKVNSINFNVLDYDKNGYPILYRASATIVATIKSKKHKTYTYSGNGTYDFSIVANSILSDNLKHNAIKEAFIRALQIIEFKIAAQGMKNDNKTNK